MKIELTEAEIRHLLILLLNTQDEGCYYGNKEQYRKRESVLIDKLQGEKK